ncbi:hypothetical protein [Nostoc sp.]|uniref:hypothetical protein n=1 Tax=Nostoc sp. TaxID=1180 RepID=UPI002FFC0718
MIYPHFFVIGYWALGIGHWLLLFSSAPLLSHSPQRFKLRQNLDKRDRIAPTDNADYPKSPYSNSCH